MLEGKVFPSERPGHFMMETWNPLGIIGVITAFNFPIAVFGWNLALCLICGNPVIWKGASTASLISIACTKIVHEVLVRNNMPPALLSMIVGGGSTVGEHMINDKRLKLVSFTGSTPIGRHVSEVVHKNFNRTILELGGNNAVIVMEDADIDLALRGALFSAVGTSGQRCTTLRRLLIHSSIYDELRDKLIAAYGKVPIGDPLDEATLMGPIHTTGAIKEFTEGLETIKEQGGKVVYGGNVIDRPGYFVEPTLVEIDHSAPIVQEELFVPILYLIKFDTIDEAIALNNGVPQGLSSGLFTKNLQYMHQWIGPFGSDCGLVNVNIGPSGAEIGGAFGGEKETGGGRESGSDAWK